MQSFLLNGKKTGLFAPLKGSLGKTAAWISNRLVPEPTGSESESRRKGICIPRIFMNFMWMKHGQINGNTVVYNFRQLKKIGRITASYQIKDRFGRGSFRFGKRERIRTGDDFPLYQTIFTAIAGLAGAGICLYAEKKKGGKGKMRTGLKDIAKAGFLVLLLGSLLAGKAFGTEAQYVSDQILYSDLEAAETIPQTAWVQIVDRQTGKERQVLLPLTEASFINERWSPDFKLELFVSGMGADYFLLGEALVPLDSPEGLLPFQGELLRQAGTGPFGLPDRTDPVEGDTR